MNGNPEDKDLEDLLNDDSIPEFEIAGGICFYEQRGKYLRHSRSPFSSTTIERLLARLEKNRTSFEENSLMSAMTIDYKGNAENPRFILILSFQAGPNKRP